MSRPVLPLGQTLNHATLNFYSPRAIKSWNHY